MDLFTYLLGKKGQNTQRDLFSYLLGKGAGGSGTYVNFTGTSLNISNTLRARIKNIELKGATSQHTTTGKNLLYLLNGTKTSNGITSVWNNGILIYSGEATNTYAGTTYVSNTSLPAGTYTFSIDHAVDIQVRFRYLAVTNEDVIIQPGNTSATFTLTKSSERMYVFLNGLTVESNYSDTLKIQLEIGSTATEYEPYTGGQPSPSPDYPQPIKVVTGEQNINVHNKNLLDTQYFENGSINATTGQNSDNIYNGRGSNYIPVLPNTTYTISANTTISALRLSEYTDEKVHIQRTQASQSNVLTITTTASTYFVRWSLNYNNSTRATQELIDSLNLQLEQNSIATSYQKYASKTYPISFGTLELAKIGDYQDYIYGTPNNWYKKSAITKIKLSDLTWSLRNWGYRADADLSNIVTPSNTNIMAILLCNVYGACTPNNAYGLTGSLEHGISMYGNMILVREAIIRDLNDFNTMISSAYAYLVNIEPTDTQITDTTLITQLNNLYNATSQEGTTYITCSSASDSNEIIVFSGDIKVASVGLSNPLNTSLLSSNIQEEPNLDDVNETEDIEQNEEPIEEEVS